MSIAPNHQSVDATSTSGNKPQFTGAPLSLIVPVPKSSTIQPLQLWIWAPFWQTATTPSPDASSITTNLAEQGSVYTLYLEEITHLQDWYQSEPDNSIPYTIILAFTIKSRQLQSIPMLNPLPLPQIGEYALVIDDDATLCAYHILKLPLRARRLWATLSDKIKELSSPSLWPAFTEYHRIASDEIYYQALTEQQKLLNPTKQEFIGTESLLDAAHNHVEQLRKTLSKASWLQNWQEIQQMAQELAKEYSEHHSKAIIAAATTNNTPAAELDPSTKKKRARRSPTSVPVPLVAKGREEITIKSDVLNHEIINALRDRNTYILYPEHKLAEHRHTFYQKDKGQILISIQPLEGESWETVLQALNTLGDGCIDTYIAVMAIAIDRNSTQHIRTPFQISPDDILAVCDKKKSHGSYTPFQRAEVIKHLKTLSQAYVVATMPGQPPKRRGRKRDDGTILRAEGALLDLLSFKIGEYHTITGEEVWEKRSIAIGEWVTMIPELNSKTAVMLRQVLAYSAKNERYQKRLGVYLTFMFRINARNGGRFPNDITMGALLEGAGIVPPRQQGEFREAIEHALESLKRDKVIGNYWRVVDDSLRGQQIEQDIREHGRGWFHAYLQQKWNFEPPQIILEQYKNLLKAASEDVAEVR